MSFWNRIFPDRRSGLNGMVAPPPDANALDERRMLVLQYASEFRRFEIEHFWQRSLFFWGPLILAFGGYASVFEKSPRGSLGIACFGCFCAFIWTLQNRGNKYWQEAWEQKVEALENEVLGVRLFSNKEPAKGDGWLSSRRYSPSRLAIILSDFTFITFLGLIVVSFLRAGLRFGCGSLDLPVTAALIGTGTFLFFAWWFGRSDI